MGEVHRYKVRETCRLCNSPDLVKVVPLGALPIASPNVGGGEIVRETASADLWQCMGCGFMQLNTVVDPDFLYRDFRYQTEISLGLREHFQALIDTLRTAGEITATSFVINVGSNDGSLLAYAAGHGARVLGIDPAEKIAEAATRRGIPTVPMFFTERTAESLAAQHGRANVVFFNNTLANIDDLNDVFAGLRAILAPDGLLIIETQYALDVVEKTLLDVIYHEHISYFSARPMGRFVAARGFELMDVERIAPKGGSIRFYLQHKGGPRKISARVDEMTATEASRGLFDGRLFEQFNRRIGQIGADIRDRLTASKRTTGRALAYGSSVGCGALIQYFDLANILDAVFDNSPLTNFIRTGSGNLPVLAGSQLANEAATDIVVLAWRYMPQISARHPEFVNAGGRFYRALPDLAYAGHEPITSSTARQ